MRVFISYGRNDALDLARKLADWLRERGDEPWLDVENGIPAGTAFDVRIEVGIAGSRVLIALLTPRSVRPEGFCRNEILYAQACNIPIVPVRVADVVPPIQIISLQRIDAVQDPDSAFAQLPTLLEQVASTGRTPLQDWPSTPAGGDWWTTLSGLDFREDLGRHGGTFVGRDWLFAQIREWVENGDSRLLLITAEPGVGKSAIAAQTTARLNVRGVHFCSRSNVASCRPAAWISGLVYQLAAQYPAYRDRVTGFAAPNWGDPPESLFRTLITDPLGACDQEFGTDEPWVFVIDALDESAAVGGLSLADLLANSVSRIPAWLRLVVTSRPERGLLARFRQDGVRHLELAAEANPNRHDLETFVKHHLGSEAPVGAGPQLGLTPTHITQAASGNFLFARMTLQALGKPRSEGGLRLEDLGRLPGHLGGLYHAMFRGRFADSERYRRQVLPLVECLAAAQGPVPESLLVDACGPDERATGEGLLALSPFLRASANGMQFFHASLGEWLADRAAAETFAASARGGHARLGEACWREYRSEPGAMSPYARAHLPLHLLESSRWTDLLALVADPEMNLIPRWVDGAEGDTGLACLEGLLAGIAGERRWRTVSAGLATQVARILSARGEYVKARRWLERALSVTSRVRGRREHAIALHELASLELYEDRGRSAWSRYRRALRTCRWGIPVYHDEAAANLVGMATVAVEEYQVGRGYRIARRAMREAARAGDARHLIAGERLAASACKLQGRFEEAKNLLQDAIALARSRGEHLELARTLLLEGHLRYDLATLREEIPDDARPHFEEAMEQAERLRHFYTTAEARVSLAWCALATRATEEANNWLAPLRTTLPERRHADLLTRVAFTDAAIAHQRREGQTAAIRYKRILQMARSTASVSSHSKALIGLGSLDWHAGRHAQAEELWQEALRLTSLTPARRSFAQCSIRICQADPGAVPR